MTCGCPAACEGSWPIPEAQAGYPVVAMEINAARERSASEWRAMLRFYCRHDLYFLLRYVLSVGEDIKLSTGDRLFDHPEIFAYVRLLEADHHNVCDIGARGTGKSTIKTFGIPIQRMLQNPQVAICFFSVRVSLAIVHLRRVKRELETNDLLKAIFDDTLYQDPQSSSRAEGSPMWTNEALLVRRTGSRMENTFEVSGFLDNMRIGPHYDVKCYDDCEDRDSITTDEQRAKAVDSWRLSRFLRSHTCDDLYTGTYYHHRGLYHALEEAGIRIRKFPAARMDLLPEGVSPGDVAGYAARKGGHRQAVTWAQVGGGPVVETVERLVEDYVLNGPQHYGQQMLCDPNAGSDRKLDKQRVQFYDNPPQLEGRGKVRLLLVDPANAKKSGSDETAMLVVGLGADENFYILDMVKRRMDPGERLREAFRLHRRWAPVRETRWEEVGLASDTFHLKEKQNSEGYRFKVSSIPMSWKDFDKKTREADFLGPLLDDHRIYLPRALFVKDGMSERHNIVEDFLEELDTFPRGSDHLLDGFCLLRESEHGMPLVFPGAGPRRIDEDEEDRWRRAFKRARGHDERGTWMMA